MVHQDSVWSLFSLLCFSASWVFFSASPLSASGVFEVGLAVAQRAVIRSVMMNWSALSRQTSEQYPWSDER